MNGSRLMGTALVAASLAVLAACGGAKSKPPMVADQPSSESATAGEPEGGDGGAEGAEPNDDTAAEAAAILQGNEEGAQVLLKQFVAPTADHAALTRSLRPTSADYKTLFDEKAASKIEEAQAKDWDSGKAIIKPKENQTEIKIWGATGAELAQGKGNAKEFPGGYKKVAKHLAADVTFFRFKFVEAGKDTGTAYDGLAFVNGHWVISPKPWKALDGKGGAKGGDDDDSAEESAPPPQKGAGKGGGKSGGKKGGGKKRGGKGGRKK